MSDAKIPLDDLFNRAAADDTLRHHEARRQARRMGDLEIAVDHVLKCFNAQQEEIARLAAAGIADREQIEKLMAGNTDILGELRALKAAQQQMSVEFAAFAESLGALVEP